MTVEKICQELLQVFEREEKKGDEVIEGLRLIYQLRDVIVEGISSKELAHILEVAKQIASVKKPLKQTFEDKLLSLIAYFPIAQWEQSDDLETEYFKRNTDSEDAKMANLLVTFAKEIYEIKVSRDAFAGKRRGYAVSILESLAHYTNVPEFMDMCAKSLKSKSKNEVIESLESLSDYCHAHKILPDKELIESIEKKLKKTKDMSLARACLVCLVHIKAISEFEAMDILDEWKMKNGW